MSRTSCRASMKFIDVTALADSSVSVATPQNFANLALFKKEQEKEQKPYGTLELNQFILDGSREILEQTNPDIAFWSEEISNGEGTFSSNPMFTATFSELHTSAGITLYFADDYPEEITVHYYGSGNILQKSYTFYPDSLKYTCYGQAEDYQRIEIEFVKTRLPNRYIKLQYVLYGIHVKWEDSAISSASIHEEIDETSNTLAINTATIEIIDENRDFDIANENGLWKSVQKTQEVDIVEEKDGMEIAMGSFFITGNSFNDNLAIFDLIDRIGLMDNYTFYDGMMYEDYPAGQILKSIFSAAKCDKYEIQSDLLDILLTGYIPVVSCREALKMVCFAVGAVADDSRSDFIRVFIPDRYVSSYIGTDRKFNGQSKVALEEYVSGVSFNVSKYSQADKTSEVFSGILEAGEHQITFSQPCVASSIETDAGNITSRKTNYCILVVDSETEVRITASTYNKTESIIAMSNVLGMSESENIKEYSGITIFNLQKLKEKAGFLLSYYSLRKKLSMQFLLESESVGDWCNVSDVSGNTATTLIESQDIDLTGGFIATTVCRGYTKLLTDYSYTGNELYAGAESLI